MDPSSSGWNIPEHTVVSITVYPRHRPKLSDIGIDVRKYENVKDIDILDEVHYIDETKGMGITVDTTTDEVLYFDYFPAAKNNVLKCSP